MTSEFIGLNNSLDISFNAFNRKFNSVLESHYNYAVLASWNGHAFQTNNYFKHKNKKGNVSWFFKEYLNISDTNTHIHSQKKYMENIDLKNILLIFISSLLYVKPDEHC